jgi:hypothetical protein
VTADDLVERELTISRFQRLVGELMRGTVSRTVFQPWEVEILVDAQNCDLPEKRRIGILRRYYAEASKQLEREGGIPMKLSEYLEQRKKKRRPPGE